MKKQNMFHCVAVVSLLIITIGSVCGQTSTVVPHESRVGFSKQVERIEKGNVQLFMVGDSITLRFTRYPTRPDLCGQEVWDEYYGKRQVANFGSSGDTTNRVIWRLLNAPLDKISPKVCVLLIGTNNISRGDSPADIAKGISKCVDILLEKFPKAQIILMEILPRGQKPNDPARLKVNATNDILRSIYGKSKVPRVVLLSANSRFLNEDGILPRKYMPDFLHPSLDGYRIWADTMEPEMEKVFGKK